MGTKKYRRVLPGNLVAFSNMIEGYAKNKLTPKELKIIQGHLIKNVSVTGKRILFQFTKNNKIRVKTDKAICVMILTMKRIFDKINDIEKLTVTIYPKKHLNTFDYKLTKGYKII